MEKILTVIVPAYNFEKEIEQCIDSIYSQKINYGFDVILRDDGSTDNTKNVLTRLIEKYPDLIILNGDTNLGGFENIKMLINSCTTKYIAYIDGDDYYNHETILNDKVEFLENNLNYSMVCSGTKYLYPDGRILPEQEGIFILSLLEDITTNDLLTINHVSFGRVFRNIPNIVKD